MTPQWTSPSVRQQSATELNRLVLFVLMELLTVKVQVHIIHVNFNFHAN